MDDVRAVGATVQLTPAQFQFVRAFYMAVSAGGPRPVRPAREVRRCDFVGTPMEPLEISRWSTLSFFP
jgi:hypothetical protein